MHRVTVLTFACAVLAATSLDAQRSLGAAAPSGIVFHPPQAAAPPPPTVTPDLFPGQPRHLPLPPPGGDLFLAAPKTYAPEFNQRLRRHLSSVYPVLSPYPLFPSFGLPHPIPHVHDRSAVSATAQSVARGYLRLDIEPRTAQVYIDGFFVGSGEDVSTAVALAPGIYRVEVRADGFETAAFDVRVRANATVRLRSRLVRLAAGFTIRLKPDSTIVEASPDVTTIRLKPDSTIAEASPTVAAGVRTLYVISRCYAGDRMPLASQLPAGCRVDDVRVIAPGNR
jgi:hypothetical protein